MRKSIADSENSKVRYLTRRMAVVAVLALAATTMIGVSSASAAATLTNTTWSVSNNQASAPAVTYTFELTTGSAGTIGSVTATVPTDTAGTVGLGTVYGLSAGTVSFVAGTAKTSTAAATLGVLTYTVTTPASVPAGTPLYIEFTGLTNTATTGPYTSTVTTLDSASATIDTGTSSSVSIAGTSTAVTVQIPKSLTFTNDTPSFTLQMDPSVPALSDQTKAVTVTVMTNAGSGYTLTANDTGLTAPSATGTTPATTYTIPAASTGTAVGVTSFAANTFGVSAALTGGVNSLAALQGALAPSGDYVGYTTTGQALVVATKPTGGSADSLVLTNRLKIDYNTAAGTYTDSITYTAAPLY